MSPYLSLDGDCFDYSTSVLPVNHQFTNYKTENKNAVQLSKGGNGVFVDATN